MGKLSKRRLKIKSLAEGYKADMTAFLRAIVANRASHLRLLTLLIKAEMEKVGFDEVRWIHRANVMGFMGSRKDKVSETRETTGTSILMRDLRMMKRSADEVVFQISLAVQFLQYMLQRLYEGSWTS